MMLQVAFTAFLLSASTMVFGSAQVTDTDLGYCMLRTYVSDSCTGEERNGFLWARMEGCKPCGDIEGDFDGISFQGPCPRGGITLYNGTGCSDDDLIDTFVVLPNYPPANETCHPLSGYDFSRKGIKPKSILMCFDSN